MIGLIFCSCLFKEFASGEMVGLVGPVEVVSVEHLLVVLVGPESLDQNDVGLESSFLRLQVHKVPDAVQLLVETHRVAGALHVSRLHLLQIIVIKVLSAFSKLVLT